MRYFSNGYYFFKSLTDNSDKSHGGFSLLLSKSGLKLELLPGTLPLNNSLRKAPLSLVLATEGNVINYVVLPLKPQIKLPLRPDWDKLLMVGITEGHTPIMFSLPKESPLNINDFTWKNAEKSQNPQKSNTEAAPHRNEITAANTQKKEPQEPPIVNFDPFNTTNLSYSWQACKKPFALEKVLRELNISLPVSVSESAAAAFNTYSHVLLGSYTEEASLRKFFILGIPTSSQDNSCAYNQKYNAARFVAALKQFGSTSCLGYHLYYIDKQSTAMVKVVVRG